MAILIAQAPPSGLERVRAATVLIEALGPRGPSTGTGFLVSTDGTVATAAHVVHGAWLVRIKLPSGDYLPVQAIRTIDPDLDLALLAAPPSGIDPVPLGSPATLRIGQRILAIGCPLGMDVSVTDGLVSAFPARGPRRMLQISAPVSPGTSGGPVVTEAGEVVGVIVSGVRAPGAENVNFALPIEHVTERLATSLAHRPTPLAELASSAAMPPDIPSDQLPPPVNAGLDARYALVDGAEILTRSRRRDGAELRSLTRVALAFSADGEPVIERLKETVVSRDGVIGTEVDRTQLQAAGPNRFSTSVRFVPVAGRAREYSSMLQVRQDRYVITDGESVFRSGRAPQGVLPPALADVVVAAIPDSLPERFEILVLDPTEDRVQVARFEFVARSWRTVPVARPGTGCEGKVRTIGVRVEVLEGVQVVGFERTPIAVLAASPHLPVGPHLKCLRIPAPPGRAMAMVR